MKKNLSLLIVLFLLVFTSMETNAQNNYDSVSFETPTSKIIIDTTENNIWQIGTPNKVFFNSAHNGTKAIVTDTLNSYPINNTSSFIYVIRNPYTSTCFTSMEFWHKYDMDTLTDIGIIEASYDGGKSWILVNDTSRILPMESNFWWDSDFHASTGNYTSHPLTTTGKSDGWILSRFNWQWWIPVKSDTIIYPLDSLMIRFTFISDSVETNKEGWMIDDILTYSAEWQLCSGIEGNKIEKKISISPNPFSSYTTLKADFRLNNATITIYNSVGQIVNQTEGNTGQTFILYRHNLPSGIYHILVTEKNRIIVNEKIVITE